MSALEDIPEDANNMGLATDVLEQIIKAKKGDPSDWASYWEQDENDVDEPSMEEIQANPILKMLWAAEENNLDLAASMLDEQADLVCCHDNDGYTPLHRASYNNHCDMIKMLVSRGAGLDARTNDGWLPLHCACKWNNAEAAELLLQHGVHINALTEGGNTPLHLTVSEQDCRNTLMLLLTNDDVDISIKNNAGDTALDISKRTSNFVDLFEIKDPSINCLKCTG